MAASEGLHARDTFSAECLGEKCPNYSAEACTNSYFEWISAKATVNEDKKTDQPPLIDETIFVTYGQICLQGANPRAVKYRIDDHGNGSYFGEETGLLVHGDSRFGTGINVDEYLVEVASDGSVTEELQRTYEGWG